MATKITAKEKKELLAMDDQIADRIREASEVRNMTNRELASQMGVAERTVNDWKANGQVSRKNIPLLCRVLDCSVGWLMTGEQESFDRPSGDDTVVEFARPITEGPRSGEDINTRHVPILEINDIVEMMNIKEGTEGVYLEDTVAQFVNDPKKGSVAVSHTGNTPGIPTYAIQCVVDFFQPHIRLGEVMYMATDILPAPGQFAAFAVRPQPDAPYVYMAGWYSPIGARVAPTHIRYTWDYVGEFVLAINRDFTPNPQDVRVSQDSDPHLLGVMTYSAYWHYRVNLDDHTGLNKRLQLSRENSVRETSDS